MAKWGAELVIERDGVAVNAVTVGGSLTVGRAADNELILSDRSVSSRHALFYFHGDEFRVRDLGSSNGTWLGDVRVNPEVVLRDGATVRLGSRATLSVRLMRVSHVQAPEHPGLLEDITAGVRHPLESDVLFVGSGAECHVRIPGARPLAATLTIYDTGEIRLGQDEDETRLEVGEVFEVGGHQLVFRPPSVGAESTFQDVVIPPHAEVALHVDIARTGGPQARFVAADGSSVAIASENRVMLLYVLARRILADAERGLDEAEFGWCSDTEAMQGVWGRQWENQDWNNYQVLVFRIRKELKAAGFDGWLVEKRRGHTRLRMRNVAVLPA